MAETASPPAAERSAEARRRLVRELLRGRPVEASAPKVISRRAGNEHTPLSWGQQLVWLHTQLSPTAPIYNEPITVRRTGSLDLDVLERSLAEILRRHEAWRTTFTVIDGQPVQVIGPVPTVRLPVVDLRDVPDGQRDGEALRLATEDARRPFDLASGPLLRGLVLRLDDADYRVCLTLHHIIFDGFSTYRVFLGELTAIYEAFAAGRPSPLPELSLQYGDYATWQRSSLDSTIANQLSYWTAQLANVPDLDLPFDRSRPRTQTIEGAVQRVSISKTLTERLRALAQREGVTLFTMLLAAFETLLHRYSGQDEFVVGTVSAGRSQVEIHELLGFFLNPLMLRADLSGNPTFLGLLQRTQEVTFGALAHEDVPFELLVKTLRPKRDPSRNPLYQVLFSLQPPRPAPPAGWDLTMWDVETGTAKLPLYLELDERPDGITGRFVFNTDLFDRATISRLAGHWQTLLDGIVANPDRPISRLPLASDGERTRRMARRHFVEPAHAFPRFPRDDINQTITRRFERIVRTSPQQIAVKTRNSEWSYKDLDDAANRVGRAVMARRGRGEEQIALLVEHGPEMIAAILGTLKAGKVYVPLDPTYPRERLRDVLEDSRAAAVVTNEANLVLATELAANGAMLINIDAIDTDAAGALDVERSPDSLAYILYTSGSTGRPKGVMQSHRNVLHFSAAYANALDIHPGDRLSLIASYSFDAAVMDVYGALLNGATLCPIDIRLDGIASLAARLDELGVTIYHSTPTVYRHFLASLRGRESFPHLRLFVLGGEELLKADVERHRHHVASGARLVNLSGQTESSMNTLYVIDDDTAVDRASVPIGYPVEDTEVFLSGPDGEPTDLRGEICIKSPHLALGYWQRLEDTRRVFVSDPIPGGSRIYRTGDIGRMRPDGSIEFVGRLDHQVKIRGVRVELGAVEAALSGHPLIKSVAARVWDIDLDKRLVAYCVPVQGSLVGAASLREYLRERLPDAMVPSAFVMMDALPHTPSGKIDRRSLPPPERTPQDDAPELEPPRNDVEARLSEIWASVLGADRVGVHSDFFEMGGHSLLAIRMFDEIQRVFGIRMPPSTLFGRSTIAGLASELARAPAGAPVDAQCPPAEVALHTDGHRPPFFFLHAALYGDAFYASQLGRMLGTDQPFYAFAPLGVDGTPIPDTVEEMATVYLAMIRDRQPSGPYQIGAFSRSGAIAIELARRLTAEGETVSSVIIVDSFIVNTGAGAKFLDRCLGYLGRAFHLSRRRRMTLYLTVKRVLGSPMNGISPDRQSTVHERVRQHYNRAAHAYVPPPIAVPIIHLWTTQRGRDVRWRRITTQLIDRVIPGDHESCVAQYLAQTAAVLSSFLIAT